MIYLFDEIKNKIQRYKAKSVNFYYDLNQWSTEYYMLSKIIIALKSPKNIFIWKS